MKENIYSDKLEVNQIFKNYKALCETLEEKVKSGDSKKAQIKEWDRHFRYDKSGHSFIIKEVYETPKEKIYLQPKLSNNRVEYIDKIEKLILDLLIQDGNDGQVFLSKNRLLKALKMVSENYSFGIAKPFKLSKMINITTKEISDFYEVSDGMLKRNLEAALNSLRKQALITWKSSLTVCHIETYVDENSNYEARATKISRIDSYGDEETTFGASQTSHKLVHRKATLEEEQAIIRAEREILIKYECKDVSEIFKQRKADVFYKEVREMLFKDLNIFLYYNSYEVISNKDQIIEEWELQEKNVVQIELNSEIVEKLKSNASNRHRNAFDKYELNKSEKNEIRISNTYLANSALLTDTLIAWNAENISYVN